MASQQKIVCVAVIVLGGGLLLFGLGDLLVPRARFVESQPAAATVISDPPSVVKLSFSNRLAAESTMEVTSTIKLLPTGELEYLKGDSVVIRSEIDPTDTSGKSMRANLKPGLHKGVYWVTWRTTTAGWRTITYGKTYFGAGMPAPAGIASDMDGSIWEGTYQWRSRRGAIVGGFVLLALGVFLWMRK